MIQFELIQKGTGKYPINPFFTPNKEDNMLIILPKEFAFTHGRQKLEIEISKKDIIESKYDGVLSLEKDGKKIFQVFDIDGKEKFWYECK